MLLDTCFLIDLQRELSSGRDFGTSAFLTGYANATPRISLITWMEFAEGYEREDACRQFLARFPLVRPDQATAWRASRIAQVLRRAGLSIGDHDIWIAATACEERVPLVTRNIDHYRRITGLELLVYGPTTR